LDIWSNNALYIYINILNNTGDLEDIFGWTRATQYTKLDGFVSRSLGYSRLFNVLHSKMLEIDGAKAVLIDIRKLVIV